MTCRVTRSALSNYVHCAAKGRVVVFDTETTGITDQDEIIQFAAVEYVKGVETRIFNRFVVPRCMIHPEAEAVHHITMQYLVEHGIAPAAALDEFFDFLGNGALLVGHNLRFDFRMLQAECKKYEYEANPSGLSYCDTLGLARKLVPGLEHYRLSFLIDALQLSGVNSHDALDDARVCGELFFNLVRRVPELPDDFVCESLEEE